MTTIAQPTTATSRGRQMLKGSRGHPLLLDEILCTTVGETFADYLNTENANRAEARGSRREAAPD